MRPVLSLILSTLMCSACSADAFDRCLGGVSFRDHEISTVTEALATEDRPSSYVATKGVSVLGLYYLVIANYEDRSTATMYRTGLGIRSVEMSAEQGLSLYESASEAISVTPKARNKGVFEGENCHFVRAGGGHERIDGEYVNPSQSESGDGIDRMFYEFGSLLDAGYGEITFESYGDKVFPLPPEYSEDELAALTKMYSLNVFHELDEIWLSPKN